jgi:hypothetical protein
VSAEPGREVPLARVIGGGVLLLVLGVLVLQFIGMFLGDDLESWEVKAPEAGAVQRAGTAVVKVRGIERQRVRIEVDGEPFFSGLLRAGESQETPPAHEISVELPDLTRSVVIYNGARVEPLGKLTTGRRLVFIDDGS